MQCVTSTGKTIPLLTDEWKPDIDDIAWGLAQIRMYSAQCLPYTYAQHSVLVSLLVDQKYSFSALMHDAHVVYSGALSDQQRQTVDHETNGGWSEYEARFARKVRLAFGLSPSLPRTVGEANQLATEYELGWLFNKPARDAWSQIGFKCRRCVIAEWPDGSLKPWTTQQAYEQFVKRFTMVGSG